MLRQTLLVLALVACVLVVLSTLIRVPAMLISSAMRESVREVWLSGEEEAVDQADVSISETHINQDVRLYHCVVCRTLDQLGVSLSPGGASTGDTTPPEAVAGDYDLSSNEGSEQEIRVSEQIVHPDYPGGLAVAANDIAVFILQSSLTLDDYAQVISLPSADSIPEGGSTAVVSGWGTTETAFTPDILQTVDVTIIDYETCRQNIDDLNMGSNPLTDTMICTGPLYDGISTCSGDSGGPLAQSNELIGVVSWGIDLCGYEGAPSVFTRVSAHLDFINQYL